MASIPLKGDRLTAKVDLTVYTDSECAKSYPVLPPGPSGLRKTTQFPGRRNTGEEVGIFTGKMSDVGFEVDYTLNYQVARQKLVKWEYLTVIKSVLVWVKRDQVTGYWDKGVDAPVIPVPENVSTAPVDNTNLFLGTAVAIAAFLKFRKN